MNIWLSETLRPEPACLTAVLSRFLHVFPSAFVSAIAANAKRTSAPEGFEYRGFEPHPQSGRASDEEPSKKVNGGLPDIYSDLEAKLTAQQGSDGGISSTYTASTNRVGSENCETTAMTIIAYKL